MKPAHRRGTYQRDAAKVRAAAYADPTTKCQRCGKTLAEHPPHKSGTPVKWDAGHPPGMDGVEGAPLLPEVSSCNRSAGASMGNRNRVGLKLRHDY